MIIKKIANNKNNANKSFFALPDPSNNDNINNININIPIHITISQLTLTASMSPIRYNIVIQVYNIFNFSLSKSSISDKKYGTNNIRKINPIIGDEYIRDNGYIRDVDNTYAINFIDLKKYHPNIIDQITDQNTKFSNNPPPFINKYPFLLR